eukprot:6890014-Ditylum_brightwellii.AAC.1
MQSCILPPSSVVPEEEKKVVDFGRRLWGVGALDLPLPDASCLFDDELEEEKKEEEEEDPNKYKGQGKYK